MISVVIPSYNRCGCILALLEDVCRQQEADFEVIVVDDASSDGSPDAIREKFPEVTVMVNGKNSGPAVTRNRGIEISKGDILVGFDSDVTVPDQFLLSKIQQTFDEQKKSCGYAFRIFEPDGETDDAPRWWHPVPLALGKDREFETNYFSGTAYAFRREDLVAAGLYPEIFYMHYEEVDLSLRLLDRGGMIRYRPDFSVVHHANPVSRRSEIKVFYKPRNQVLLAILRYPFWRALGYVIPRLGKGMIEAVRMNAMKDWIRAMLSARDLADACFRNRKPVGRESWRRMAAMKHQFRSKGVNGNPA